MLRWIVSCWGLERTSKFKFEGGDTAWEEEKLGSYATSEVRFVEIQEKLCSEVTIGKDQCYNLLEEYDESLEACYTLEKECMPCPGFPDNICHNNGHCKGSGTRKGDGKCHCDRGYAGDYCDKCANSYYESYRDDKKLLCSECHISCEGDCTKAGAIGCTKCKSGWVLDKEKGCLDLNECATSKSPCSPLQFCVNNEGGYRCLDCDRSCAGCTGDGPDMCVNCASGYYKKDNICIDASDESRKNFVFYSRYLTYMGLCIATFIILNKSTYLAAIVGSCVAIYISVSEYMLNSAPTPKKNIEHQVAEQVLKAFN
ncbi:hypothetical protein NQ317_019074 [Molorchus minor]|uniref:EGF-like domain-containing protein n=1 Tax=Molorchus minor TaxID=1323400 RepID=A0ABQ9IR09_9CUCU|nr:hypothetical protein NQ317_019074 [Molorchus minor]